MKKSEWLDCQRNEFFPKQKGIPSLVKIEHKNTATLDSVRSKKKSKVAVLQLEHNTVTSVRLEAGDRVGVKLPVVCRTSHQCSAKASNATVTRWRCAAICAERQTNLISQDLEIHIRSKKRIKGQNFCQTIDYLSFHRFYQSIKRQICHYLITFSCATFCINKTARCRKE